MNGPQQPQTFDMAVLTTSIVRHKTTKAEVEQLLGAPATVNSTTTGDVWVYHRGGVNPNQPQGGGTLDSLLSSASDIASSVSPYGSSTLSNINKARRVNTSVNNARTSLEANGNGVTPVQTLQITFSANGTVSTWSMM